MTKSCATCEWGAKHPVTGHLQCRYNPPQLLSAAVQAQVPGIEIQPQPQIRWIIDGAFPTVSEKFWCRQYEAKISDRFSEVELAQGARN